MVRQVLLQVAVDGLYSMWKSRGSLSARGSHIAHRFGGCIYGEPSNTSIVLPIERRQITAWHGLATVNEIAMDPCHPLPRYARDLSSEMKSVNEGVWN